MIFHHRPQCTGKMQILYLSLNTVTTYVRTSYRKIGAESLAHAIYQRIAAMRGVKRLRVATSKPDIYPNAKGVGVEIASEC